MKNWKILTSTQANNFKRQNPHVGDKNMNTKFSLWHCSLSAFRFYLEEKNMIRISVPWSAKKILKAQIGSDFPYQFLELHTFQTCSKWQLTCWIMAGALCYKTIKQ